MSFAVNVADDTAGTDFQANIQRYKREENIREMTDNTFYGWFINLFQLKR